MKLWFACLTAALALNSASAQLLSPESVNGALLGTFIGGSVGGDRHCGWSGKGAAIGAGVGLVLGTIAGESRRQQYYSSPYYYPSTYGYDYTYTPTYSYLPSRPNYAISGTLAGAASGALIGEAAAGKPGNGAAIGAAAGLVLGSVAEQEARRNESRALAADPPSRVARVSGTAPRSPWQTQSAQRYQIPDAPRVPDAPTF